MLTDLLEWILKQRGVSFCIHIFHYLDDFLAIGPSDSFTCQRNLHTIQQVCKQLGIPLALEKVEGPSTSLNFLGITLDTSKMEAHIPTEKLQRAKELLSRWMAKKKATKREILSLIGILQHATEIVRNGRTFLSQMYQTTAMQTLRITSLL